jgi:CxxC motif-containing protein (DUF1111 family)
MTLGPGRPKSHAASHRSPLHVAAALLISWVFVVLLAIALGACAKPPAAGEPLAGLTPDERARFERGREVFERAFADSTGLGPTFNAESCLECHEDPVSGGNGDEIETHATLVRPDGTCDLLTDRGGPVFQTHVTAALTRATGLESEPIPDEANARALRTAPDAFGFGLLEAIPDADILKYADPDDRDQDGVSGRPNRFFDGRLGRFGRKALVPDLDSFNAAAFPIEMGVTTSDFPVEETVGGKPIPEGVDPTPEPEIDAESVARLRDFIRFLAPPPALSLQAAGRRGRDVFAAIGCVSCHTPAFTTGPNPVRALDRKTVRPYTDLLLHDMGADRADICLGLASPSEFRTEPLMGLRFVARFLHDGAAATLEDAIELHGGEGARAREKFRQLSAKDRAALLEFLHSL